MTWIVLTPILLGIALVLFVGAKTIVIDNATYNKGELNSVKYAVYALGGAFVLVWLLMSALSMTYQVPAGHVGVVYEFGAITGQTEDGFQVVAPWTSVKNANVQVQRATFDNVSAASAETQDVNFVVTINYQVSPNAVQFLYTDVGEDYFDRLVEPRLNTYFKDETVNYPAIEVTRNRDEIREVVAQRLGNELERYSITVVDLLVDNINYSAEFNQSIEDKQVATQNAERERERVRQSEFEADQRIARAHGEAEALIETARGQAQANKLLDESLTEDVIQFKALELAFGPDSPIQFALIPSGEGLIIDPTTLLNSLPSEGSP